MSGISKRVSGSWVSGDYGIMGTSTDTLTTLPAVLYPNAVTATVGLKGNMSQSGTPTPQNPIQPSECGERTENLLNYNRQMSSIFTTDVNYYIYGGVGNSTNTDTSSENVNISISSNSISVYSKTGYGIGYIVEVQPNTTYTLSFDSDLTLDNKTYAVLNLLTEDLQFGTMQTLYDKTHSFTTNNATKYVYIVLRVVGETCVYSNVMLNTGSIPLPYEPYGQYKIPISSASTTTPVYLGEVETTRRIKRLVLTGEETWTKGEYPISDSVYHFYMPNPTGIMGNLQSWIISHFVCGRLINGTAMGLFFNFYPQTSLLPENPTANDFKAWIAAQYAAGTPVTIWYVLAEPETGIVNEPIRKIGNYADTISGITIPTTAGANSFDVLTTLKPSEVTVNYHGWHPVQSVHEYDSNYTIATMQALTIAQLQSHTIGDLEGGEWA